MDIPDIPEGLNTWQRDDGAFIEYLDLEHIQKKKERAEFACIRLLDNSGTWLRFYEDTSQETKFIQDFNLMLQELKHLRVENQFLKSRTPDQFGADMIAELEDRIRDLSYKLESLGEAVK